MFKTRAFIAMDPIGSRVTLNNTKFLNFLFSDGIVTNVNHFNYKGYVLNPNYHDNILAFNCQKINPNFTECHSIKILDSVFDGYNYGSNYFQRINSRFPSSTLGTEAFIVRSRSLNGPIVVKGSIFRNIITLKKEILASDVYSDLSGFNKISSDAVRTVENIARILRKETRWFKR